MIYIILGVIALIMVGATVCTLSKAGEKENICKYNHKEK